MSVVIDASLTMAWYFEDESTPATDAVLDRVSGSDAVVPVTNFGRTMTGGLGSSIR